MKTVKQILDNTHIYSSKSIKKELTPKTALKVSSTPVVDDPIPEYPQLNWRIFKLRKVKGSVEVERNLSDHNFCRRSTLVDCCAYDIFHSFADFLIPNYSQGGDEEKAFLAGLCLYFIGKAAAPFAMCTTNSLQLRTANALKKIGFEMLKSVQNPNSGREVKMWVARTRF